MSRATLTIAAGASYTDCNGKTGSGVLKSALASFAAAMPPIFPDAIQNNRQVGNWAIPIQALSASMSASLGFSTVQLNLAADLIYRACFAGVKAQANGFITAGQGTSLLAAYNAFIF